MKTKYAIVFIFIVALVILEKESNILSRVSDKLTQRQTPLQTSSTPLHENDTAQSVRKEEQEEEAEAVVVGHYNASDRHKHILLMATTRSGSSFVGEFFNQHGDMFYLFEPLWHMERMLSEAADSGNTTGLKEMYRDVVQGLFLCDFSSLERYIWPAPQDHVTPSLFRRESSSSLCEESVCSPVVKDVFERYHCKNRRCGPLNLTLASQSCLSKKHHAIKTVRVRLLDTLRPLVEDPRLDVTVIQLVRDPRAVLASRMVAFSRYQAWNSWAQDGDVPEDDEQVQRFKGTCDQIRMSAELGLGQPGWLRGRYMLVRYEDIAHFPMQKAEEMYRFTGIPFSAQAKNWILQNTQTMRDVSGVYSTQKNSSEQAEKWRFRIPFKLAQLVQKVCGPAMKMFGYKFVHSEAALLNRSLSLLEERQFSLPQD
ncbi:hypothetical protein CRUP_006762 [Coryphaenoides rupestris]|nr:hypothetical protein CRUP_006762 [Coryphaenoides rupestris]